MGTGFGLFLIRELLGFTGITITETGERGKAQSLRFWCRKVNSGKQNEYTSVLFPIRDISLAMMMVSMAGPRIKISLIHEYDNFLKKLGSGEFL